MTTSSAVPGWLLRYGREAGALDAELTRSATDAANALARFRHSNPDFGYSTTDPATDTRSHAVRSSEVDAWVERVGLVFQRADNAPFVCRIPPEPVVIDDALLTAAGFPTRGEAAAAGTAFAHDIARALAADEEIDRAAFEQWRDTMRAHQADPAYTAAVYNVLGAERTLQLVMAIENHYPRDEFGDPRWGLDVLRPFSHALATAMDTRLVLANRGDVKSPANLTMPDALRLREDIVDALVVPPTSYDYEEPQEHHVGLLFREGVFPTDVLVDLANNVVTWGLWRDMRSGPFGITAWGPAVDPMANVLGALSRDAGASLTFLSTRTPHYEDSNLRMFLERWANDLDGDGGQNAAAVLAAALRHPDKARSAALLDEAIAITADLGEVRNWFNNDALVAGAAAHIDRLTTVAAAEGEDGHARLLLTYEFLTTLLEHDDAASRVYEATLQHIYDRVGDASSADTLGSETWEIGSLLGLLLTADARAEIDDTKQRIARREALLDGIASITDLALTFTRGKWIPFATTGRDALLDSFRNDDDLDEALADVDAFEAELRYRLSVVLAVRLVQNGDLPPPPGGLQPLEDMTPQQRDLFDDWVNSARVRDSITPLRTQAGQRMDELERLLPEPD